MRRRAAVRVRTTLVVFAALSLVAAMLAYAFWRRVSEDIPALRLPMAPTCLVAPNSTGASTPAGEPVLLDPHQMANAATIAAVGIRRGVPRRAVVVALATAWQESKLENLPGGDRDSIGLFQQRPSQGWGRPDQISDPRYAANKFYTALLRVKNWQKMRVTEAAQAVQRSAFPEYYEKWAAKSEILASALTGEAGGAVACTIGSEPPHRGLDAADKLAASLRLDWGDVRTASPVDRIGLTVTAPTDKVGWQYAHWLVAHAEVRGIKRVSYADREWTAKQGEWRTAQTANVGGTRVVAEVYTA